MKSKTQIYPQETFLYILLICVVRVVFIRMHCFEVSLKLLLPGGVELTVLAPNAFSFRGHSRSLDVHVLHVTLHFVVACQQLSTDSAWNFLPTLQLLHLVHVFYPFCLTYAILNVEIKVSLLYEILVAMGTWNCNTTVFPFLMFFQINASLENLTAKLTVKTQVQMCSFKMSFKVDFARVFIFILITFVVSLAHVD